MMYRLVKPYFGSIAGRFAALGMTLTPIVVADSRTNNMDATLVFFLLLALLFLEKAIFSKKSWWVMGSFALIGVAFNIKMLQAFMILPAMYLFYWLAANETWKQKIKKLVLATIALVIFTLAWPLSVDLTNSSSRPYVGGSTHNSVLELAFGYNGSERLLGQTTGTGGSFGNGMTSKSSKKNGKQGQMPTGAPTGKKGMTGGAPTGKTTKKGGAPTGKAGQMGGTQNGGPGGTKQKGAGGAGGGGGAFAIGTAGPFRIFQSDLGPQISWLLPFALFGIIGGLVYYRDRKKKWYHLTAQQKQTILWVGWLVPVYGFFSIASFFHPYYMIMLAPAISALFGIGVKSLSELNQGLPRTDWKFYLLPLATIATAGLQSWYVYSYYPWLTYIILALGVAFAGAMILAHDHLIKKIALVGGLSTILAAPGWWSLTPTLAAESSAIPSAGPSLLSSSGGAGGGTPMGDSNVNTKLLNYVSKRQGNAKYLMGTNDSNSAAPYIIKSGKAVMALGGYNGTDEALTLKQFKHLVKTGQIKYFYISGKTASASSGQIGKILAWIKKNGTKVNASAYGGTTTQATAGATKSSSSSAKGQMPSQGTNSQAGGQNGAPGTMGMGQGQGGPGTGTGNSQGAPGNGTNKKPTKKPSKKMSKKMTKKMKKAMKKNTQAGGMQMGGGMQSGVLYDLSSIYDAD
ncbi:4-amino-4-deoxy-L-arabinose transferase [Ligilactobacillus salitolerans]|uniref:4-amino-4-deoxy-L-arabinose transferase n=1 Tax=Ligilactobacillus salitolerans TaxID=1808352 RepID=A0A401IQC5_9LACO|nr:4-amino-4-deoxy-L-arabinose transferase [Ligilactobacillus salitolerans]